MVISNVKKCFEVLLSIPSLPILSMINLDQNHRLLKMIIHCRIASCPLPLYNQLGVNYSYKSLCGSIATRVHNPLGGAYYCSYGCRSVKSRHSAATLADVQLLV